MTIPEYEKQLGERDARIEEQAARIRELEKEIEELKKLLLEKAHWRESKPPKEATNYSVGTAKSWTILQQPTMLFISSCRCVSMALHT